VQNLQRMAGTVLGLTLTTLIVFWTVKGTKPSGSAVLPALYGTLVASALIWLLTALLRQRASRSRLDLHIEGVLIGEADFETLLQLTVRANNTGTGEAVVHGWTARLALSGRTHDLRQVLGQDRLHGSVDLPFLDRIGPLRPGQTAGLLQFAVPALRQSAILEALDSWAEPIKLLLELKGGGRRSWRTEADLQALATQKRASAPSRTAQEVGAELAADLPQGIARRRGGEGGAVSHVALADIFANLYGSFRELREKVEPEQVSPFKTMLNALNAFTGAALEQREAQRLDGVVRRALVEQAYRFVPDWDDAASLPPNDATVPGTSMLKADVKQVATFLDAKMVVLRRIIAELREGR
jgi:hypothetical protein